MTMHRVDRQHAILAARAFEQVLGHASPGSMAFVRCLGPEVVAALAAQADFAPKGWKCYQVVDQDDEATRSITADRAVELREDKGPATLLLVDTNRAGAGMDGIYSAAQEVSETLFFDAAWKLAGQAITQAHSASVRYNAELAIRRAQGHGGRHSLSPWVQFDYLVRVAEGESPSELLYLLNLWPAQDLPEQDMAVVLTTSRLFVDRLLGNQSTSQTPAQRIATLNLLDPTPEQRVQLEQFVRKSAIRPLQEAMSDLSEQPEIWINSLRAQSDVAEVQSIELRAWRSRTNAIYKWSGLTADPSDPANPPQFIMDPQAQSARTQSKLTVQWSVRPETVKRGSVHYEVSILTDMGEEIASQEIPHSAKNYEKCVFTNDDFSLLDEDDLIPARVVVSVVGSDEVEAATSEEILIKFGEQANTESTSTATRVRSLVEGVIDLAEWETVTGLVDQEKRLPTDNQGFITLRTPDPKKSYKVFRPPLIQQIEEQWAATGGGIGRWQVRVRISGERAGAPVWLPLGDDLAGPDGVGKIWNRAAEASRRMAELLAATSAVAQIYDDRSAPFRNVVKEYLLAWADLLAQGESGLALANTVEVQSLSGSAVGLIVLPHHPLRVAWHVAYDNLALYTAFEKRESARAIRKEFASLDGAMFPAFLPGLEPGSAFVFADTLGFHTVGMVLDQEKEPKASVAMLARAMGESDAARATPVVTQQSAAILGREIQKYLDCHITSNLLHVHALRAGDAMTVARALGAIQQNAAKDNGALGGEGEGAQGKPAFVLNLYPAEGSKRIPGRFIAEAREKRRRGAGVLAEEDRWLLDSLSLPGGINRPLLRWARKPDPLPESPAHLAIAFDTFESRVIQEARGPARPYFAYGLFSFFDRSFQSQPAPFWHSAAPIPGKGEKHPGDRTHTERLSRIQQAIEAGVSRQIQAALQSGEQVEEQAGALPVLRTEITPEKTESLNKLHRLCDWVITLDRNAGVEYFDSPHAHPAIYDAYIIDAVPERDDLGCLQLITSTSNLEEMYNLLGQALDQMGLSYSRRNADFLMQNLKALSGRLAIRLTGQHVPSAELIGLAMSHANCRAEADGEAGGDSAWVSLHSGFLIPVDDVLDLIPPLSAAVGKGGDISRSRVRPDLIYVSLLPRKGLAVRFIEVKYRRHLRTARIPDLLDTIDRQARNLRREWQNWFSPEDATSPLRSVRRAKLARVLRFYADKARRHHLSQESYQALVSEIDRMVERGAEYSFAQVEGGDRGWIFCPEFAGETPLNITPWGWETQIFLFGPAQMDALRLPSPPSDLAPQRVNGADPVPGEPAPRPSATVTQPQVEQTGDGDLPTDDIPDRDETQAEAGEATSHEQREGGGAAAPGHVDVLMGHDLFSQNPTHWTLTTKGNPHLLLAGLPGMGKTTCLLNLCQQMIQGGVSPIIFSYHQDIDEKLVAQTDDVRFIDFRGLGFNPLQVFDRAGFMPHLDVAGAMRDIFTAIYPELGDIQGDRIRTAIKQSFEELGWGDPAADLTGLAEPPFRRFLEILRAEPKPDRGLKTLLARLTELDDYGFFAPGEAERSLWEESRPTVIRIHATQNESLQQAFASLIFYGLYKDMFRRGPQDRITHALIFDEAHRAARLGLLPTMAKECRKYGISLVVASQEARDFHPSLFSAIANYLVLRLTDADAKALTRNVASSDQERVLIDKIKQMPRFRALYFQEGQRKPAVIGLLGPIDTAPK